MEASWGPELSHSHAAGHGVPRKRGEKCSSCPGAERGRQPLRIHNPRTPSQVEQRLEPAKRAAHNVHKRLQACLQGQSGADMDKRVVSGGPGEEGPGQGGSKPRAGVSPPV